MARYDKYDPFSGGFRALLAEDFPKEDLNKVIGVGLNADGHLVPGAGRSGVRGVLILTKARKAGDVVDVMTDGEIVDLHEGDSALTPVPGTLYYVSDADGTLSATASTNQVGTTVAAQRLVVRFQTLPAAAGGAGGE